jgi:hypothetical protein
MRQRHSIRIGGDGEQIETRFTRCRDRGPAA